MSKNCLNCGCEISGEGKNKIFCDDCLSKVSPFLKFVSKSPTPAMKLYELNVGKLRAQGFSEDALKYIEKCCTRYDEKHAASAAAATAAASAAVINDIDVADEPLGKNSSVVTGDDGGIEISGGAQGGAGYGNDNADVNPDDPLIAAALSALEASSAANAANAANASEDVTPPANDGLSFDGLNFENTLDNEATSIYGAVGAASAAGAAGAAGAAVSSGGYGGGGHRPREFDEGEVGHSDMDKHRLLYIYILLGVAAILLIIFLIIFISGRGGGNDDETSNTSGSGNVADVTTTADDTTVADDSTYADDTTGEGETTGADDTTGTDDTTSADDTTAADDTTTADDTTAADVTTADNGTTTYYTVSFNLNYDGATGAPANQVVASGSTATTPTSPTRTGYTFSGWYLRDGTKYNFSTAVSSDVTLYAHWATSTYTVTFNLNYTGATGTPASQSVSYGGTVAAPTSPTIHISAHTRHLRSKYAV
ncbi:MAG: InlB B-repeat-containing protein, partial [Firmicutes bacterium]|nr:InlB B-repeat-containing protein [Bacillota bacterium]